MIKVINTKMVIILTVLLVGIIVFCTTEATYADTEPITSGDYEYVLNDDGTITITKYSGTGEGNESGEFIVPSQLDGYPVKKIGNEAFSAAESNDSNKLVISEGIEEIGQSSFSGFYYNGLSLPSTLKTIGYKAFYGYQYCREITIPSSVETMGSKCMGYLSRLNVGETKITGFIIAGSRHSAAETYAYKNGFEFRDVATGDIVDPDEINQGFIDVQKLQSDLETAQNDLGTIREELETTKGDLEDAKTELETTKGELETKGGELDTANTLLSTLKSQLTTSQSNLEKARKEIESLKKTRAVVKTNTMTANGKTATVKYANVKKKNQTIAAKSAFAVSKAQGVVTYKKASGNSKITVSSLGVVTVKKGLKKGTYKVSVKVTANGAVKVASSGTTAYKAVTKTVTTTIKVK